MRLKHFPKESAGWLALILSVNMAVYAGARVLTENRVHCDLSLWIDREIPLLPFSVVIYLGCYLFWAVNYVLAVREGGDKARRFAQSDLLAKAVCFVIYLALPTAMDRPQIAGDSIWEQVLSMVYAVDAADNLFPSIHCLVSWLSYLGVREDKGIPGWYVQLSKVFAFMVFASTLTVKQHVAVDVLAGWLLAEASWRLCPRLSRRRDKDVERRCSHAG